MALRPTPRQTTSTTAVMPNAIEDVVEATFEIGAHPEGTSYAAPIDIPVSAMYHVVLSDADITLLYDCLKKRCA